jgi:hypothetical protein
LSIDLPKDKNRNYDSGAAEDGQYRDGNAELVDADDDLRRNEDRRRDAPLSEKSHVEATALNGLVEESSRQWKGDNWQRGEAKPT